MGERHNPETDVATAGHGGWKLLRVHSVEGAEKKSVIIAERTVAAAKERGLARPDTEFVVWFYDITTGTLYQGHYTLDKDSADAEWKRRTTQ